MESESLIPFKTKGYGWENRSRRVYKPSVTNMSTRLVETRPVPSVDSGLEDRSLPLPYDFKKSHEVLEAFYMFNVDNPHFSKDYKLVHGELLRATVEFYCAFNSTTKQKGFCFEVATRSITEKGFNEKYSKVYKYSKQCLLGINWVIPDEFPFPDGIYKITTWRELRDFLKKAGNPATPELILPPELLYPWESPIPEDIEYLEEQHAEPDINMDTMIEIIESKLKPPQKIPTMTDFILSQTNTKMSVRGNTIAQVKKLHGQKKKLTDYKYRLIPEWADKGFPNQDILAVRTPVWKRTTEYRDAITLNPYTLHKVWELNSYLKHMIDDPGVGDYKDMVDMKIFAKSYSFFILTDWKKSGLTIPHWFVKLVVQAVNKIAKTNIEFPVNGIPIFDPTKNKWFVPSKFGYGLGMVNNCYTLFNLCLFEYAKRQGIFEKEDKMYSFNDDSVIGSQDLRSYNGWISICQKTGGYLDIHKTYTATGVQFCEMHQFRELQNNFKWVSAFNTTIKAVLNSANWDHWRFLVSDSWDQIRGFDSSITDDIPWQNFYGTAEHYVKTLGSAYWNVRDLPEAPPELGGVAIGQTFRTSYSLKGALTILEQKTGWDLIKSQSILRASKEAFSWTPQFRPWAKMPDGPTKSYMILLGKHAGIHHELESFSLKAQNKFVTDSKWYLTQFWSHYSKKINEAITNPILDHDFWVWCKQEKWPTYAIPSAFVTKEEKLPLNQKVLPFVRMSKDENRYSLPSQMEAYIKYMRGEIVLNIPVEEINLKDFLLWESPVIGDIDHYQPICDMELISKIASFSDPRRVFLDYWWRNNSVITGLDLPDFRSDAALDLISTLEGHDIRSNGFDKATWYTRIPLPYRSCWSDILTRNLPDMHENIIMHLLDGQPSQYEETAIFLKEDFDNNRREDKQFWKKKTKSKIKSHEKKKKLLEGRATAQTTTEEEPLTLLNMDDIQQVMIKILSSKEEDSNKNLETVEYQPFSKFTYTLPEDPEWLNAECSSPKEEEYNWEQEEDEDSLIAKALDQLNSWSEVEHDPG
jgi:hypothetical protein